MAITKKNYTMSEMKKLDLNEAPSLDLRHIRTDAVYVPKDGGKYMVFFTHVSKKFSPEGGCPFCGSKDLKFEGRAAKPRVVHDVIRNNFRVDIAIMPPRMSCKTCKGAFTPNLPGISGSRQMTTRLEDFIRKECFLQPFSILEERTGFTSTTISDIMDEEIDKYEAKRKAKPVAAPKVLGIDEKHLRSAARGTLVDIENGILLDILEDNKTNTMQNAIKGLKGWDKRIKVVTTDMNNSYVKWLPELLPKATIVIDKFHVIKDVEQSITACKKALVKNRKKMIADIEDPEERARQSAILRIVNANGRLFNYSIAGLVRSGDDDRLAKLTTVIDEFPEFKMLHNLHYTIEYLYEQETREKAEEVWKDWLFFLPPGDEKGYKDWCDTYCFDKDCFEAFRSFSRRGFQQFAPYILNYFNSPETRVTNAATEGLNSLIGDVNISGKGYSFKHLRAKCLYAPLIHEKINYGIDMKTVKKWDIKETYTMGYMTPDMLKRGFSSGGSSYKWVNEWHFTKEKVKCCIPKLTLFGSNEWLNSVLDADYVRARESEYRKITWPIREYNMRDDVICGIDEMLLAEYAYSICG